MRRFLLAVLGIGAIGGLVIGGLALAHRSGVSKAHGTASRFIVTPHTKKVSLTASTTGAKKVWRRGAKKVTKKAA